jgi:small subunit ribosomal protein S3
MDNPQIEVQEITKSEFDPDIMAKQLAGSLERGFHFRRSSYSLLRQIMKAGALGCEIGICGKVSGGRSRTEKFKEGYIKHCGDTADKYVKESVTQATLKAGVLGIRVKITPPMEGLFNELRLTEPKPKAEDKKPEKIDEKADKEREMQEKAGKGNKKPEKKEDSKKEASESKDHKSKPEKKEDKK